VRQMRIALAAAVLIPAMLAGCAGQPATPGGGDTGGGGAATSGPAPAITLPATFPAADVPLIEGEIVYAQDLGTGWVVYVHRDDFNAGYEEAKGLLTGAGFAGDTVNQDDTGSFGQFTSDAYTVNLSSGDGADLGVGLSVGYTVVKN
jgi:hypothetical protein